MGDHEITAAAAAIRLEAAAKGISHKPTIVAAIEGVGGTAERLGTKVKGRTSLERKLADLARRDFPLEVNDSLRYTAVLDFERYWERSAELVSALRGQGYVVDDLTGWKAARYQGMNLTLRDSDGFEFELQFHTTESLRASDETHAWYEEIRERSTSPVRLAQLRRLIDDRYAVVPRPPGVPMVD